MNLVKQIGYEERAGWNVRIGLFICQYCGNQFTANINDVKRNRVRHCGCSKWNEPLPKEINSLKVVQDLGTINHRRTAIFQCPECPNQFKATVSDIKAGNKRLHCGCKRKHKESEQKPLFSSIWDNPLFNDWTEKDFTIIKFIHGAMKARCNTKSHPKYRLYGARGISVCKRWHSLYHFMIDIGKRPADHLSLDRINNDGNYEPSNVRWATQKQQQNNKRHTI